MKLALLFTSVFSFSTWAVPAEVILIRHAEKPEQGSTLSPSGEAHAQELASYFTSEPEVLRFGTPTAMYAMAPSHQDGSVRAIETIQPLAAKLGLSVNTAYTKMQFEPMADEIMANPDYDGKMVLICWEHKVIRDIALSFGVQDDPGKWHGDDFDSVYRIDFNLDKSVKSFTHLHEH